MEINKAESNHNYLFNITCDNKDFQIANYTPT